MEIYLIRHTETNVEKGICYGQADVPLMEPYLDLFSGIADKVPGEDPVIYSSPLQRCKILSEYLYRLKQSSDSIIYDERLKELNFGNWELNQWEVIDDMDLENWSKDFVSMKVPGGESFQELYNRVTDFIASELSRRSNNDRVIIVTHAGVIRCFYCYANNVPLKDAFNFQVSYGAVTLMKLRARIVLQ